jgi:hypothetical protein
VPLSSLFGSITFSSRSIFSFRILKKSVSLIWANSVGIWEIQHVPCHPGKAQPPRRRLPIRSPARSLSEVKRKVSVLYQQTVGGIIERPKGTYL